ncbi:MAG: hypothetical protein KJO29_14110, partial [Bacteroidia bacterium]|nr:hypothetical protein [Bacteroidia bacterium]
KMRKLLVCLLAFAAIQSCTYNEYLEEDPIDPNLVSFSEDIIPFFNTDCNTSGCHGVGDIPPDLSPANAYDALIIGNYIDLTNPANSELYQWMKGNRNLPMPLSGPDAEANSKVLAWISQGALDN